MTQSARSKSAAIVEIGDRTKALTAARNAKMADSPHRFVRGSTEKFYEWLAHRDRGSLPEVEPVWICGDCHVGNLGPVANSDGKVAIEVRDLDQTVPGNPAHDLIRLALSLASAARGASLPGLTVTKMFEAMANDYAQAFVHPRLPAELTPPPKVLSSLRKSRARGWNALAKERLGGKRIAIPLGRRFWPLNVAEREALQSQIESEAIVGLVRSLKHRADDAEVKILDAAYWVKGCSSLGALRYAVLAQVSDKQSREICLLDFKEARPGVAPSAKGADLPSDQAERVVVGARVLAPSLGERMVATKILGRSMFVRELMPSDLKLEIETLPEDEALGCARYLSRVVGAAHARQMSVAQRRAWAGELRKGRSKSLDAPSWLWLSVVDLLAVHEKAYLEHCRRQVLAAA